MLPAAIDVVPTGHAVQLGLRFVPLPPVLNLPTGQLVQLPPEVGVKPVPALQMATATCTATEEGLRTAGEVAFGLRQH